MLAIGMPAKWAAALIDHEGWRLLMMSGALPAVLTFFIMACVPESEKWKHGHSQGSTSHMSGLDLIGTVIGTAGAMAVVVLWTPFVTSTALRIIGTIIGLVVTLAGFLYPIIRYMQRAETAGSMTSASNRSTIKLLLLGASLSGVALLGTWGSMQWASKLAGQLAEGTVFKHAKENTQIALSLGAIVGTVLAALAAGKFGRRITYCALCLGSMASLLFLYQFNTQYGASFLISVFIAGGVTASFYGFFPLYLPELFPTSIRSTSQGFAYNFGRVLASIGTLQTAQVMAFFGGSFPKAGSVLCVIYVIGAAIIWLGPETKGKPLPD
jgi:MFS family permease